MTAGLRSRPDTVTVPAGAAPRRRAAAWSVPEVRWAAAATALFGLGLLTWLGGGPAWLSWTLYAACYAAGGWEPALAGLRALRGGSLDVDLLMVAAAVGAAAIGQVVDGGLLIVIFATSGALEAVATRRTADSVRGLLDLAPDRATRVTPDGERTVDARELAPGDVVLVRPGERVGADGHVIGGASEVDQAGITGEGLPVAKEPGDEVFAGTVNGTGMLRIRVDRPGDRTVIARIVDMVEQASATKARTQLFVERIEQRYSVGMVAVTLALLVLPPLFGAAFQPSLLRAMTFMIVASPCAVVLATMPPLLSAIANAGRHGVLVKSAVVMEQLGQATRVAFDKTGTLTEGVPQLSGIRTLPGGPDERTLLALAAAAEGPSEHPLARAVVAAARERGIRPASPGDFASAPGRGVRARVGGRLVEAGSPAHILGRTVRDGAAVRDGADEPESADGAAGDCGDGAAVRAVAELEESGQTVIVVRLDGRLAGALGLADRMRPEAPGAVERLAALTGRPPVLLTGDNPRAARRLAGHAGIVDVRAGLLPDGKVAAVRDLQDAGDRILLAGDGVNDAPALATAHVGLAMGRSGSGLAVETADAVIVHDELPAVPAVVALSRRARRLVVANLVIAAAFIAGLVAWDLAGHLPLPLGVAGHEGSTVVVGLNGLRLLRAAAWRRGAGLSAPRGGRGRAGAHPAARRG